MPRRFTYLIFSIFLVLLLVSCNQDPKDKYLSYIKKAENIKEYKVVYKLEMSMLKALGAGDFKMGVFKKNDNQKSVVEINIFGASTTAYTYNIDGKSLTCTKGGYSLGGDSDKVVCTKIPGSDASEFAQFGDFTTIALNVKSDDMAISYTGESEIIGRKCDKFSIDVKNISKLLNSSSGSGLDLGYGASPFKDLHAKLDVCMDKKTAIPLLTKIYTKSKSELDDKTSENELLSITATSLDTSVDDSVFVIPVAYSVLGAACDKSEIVAVLEPYKDVSGAIKVNDLGNSYGAEKTIQNTFTSSQKSLQKNKVAVLQFDVTKQKQVFGSSYEICVGDDCQSFYCHGASTKCAKKSSDKSSCESDKECVYSDGLCGEFSCSALKDQSSCRSNDCTWQAFGAQGYCYEKMCGDFKAKGECQASRLGCNWFDKPDQYGGYCGQLSCYDLTGKSECESSKLNCEWSFLAGPTGEEYSSCQPISCYNKKTENDCSAMNGCEWFKDQYGGAYCEDASIVNAVPLN